MIYILVVVLLFIFPYILGAPLSFRQKLKHEHAYALCVGLFIELALFQFPAMFFVVTYGNFQTLKTIYSIMLLLTITTSVFYLITHRREIPVLSMKKMAWNETLYLFAFVCVATLQIIRCVTNDITYMSYDDAGYVAIATDALSENGIGTINAYTGEYIGYSSKYAISSWLYFPAYISSITGISVPIVVHTVLRVFLTIFSYISCWCLAGELFGKNKEGQLIFILLVSVLYWFGYHSHYSITFRMLGPNYQGKAVVATVMMPLLYALLIHSFDEEYKKINGIGILILSVASGALTLWGTGVFIITILLAIVIFVIKRNWKWKKIRYLCYGCIIPAVYCFFFFFIRLAV